jgi:hypothetical protein
MKDTPMFSRHALCGLAVLAAALVAHAQTAGGKAADSTVRTRLTLRSQVDFGHLVSGNNPDYTNNAGQTSAEVTMLPLNRVGFVAIQDVAQGRFDVSAGIAALLWTPYGSGVETDERVMQARASIPVARVRWQFGEPSGLAGSLMVGTFPYKYNPDAKNLGEYLYRSGTYPGFLMTTEGWLLMNRASNYSHGAMLTLTQLNGALRHNFSLFMETVYFPIGDFSPGYDVSYTSKWFEVGGGAMFHHYLPLKPSALTPKTDENTYVRQTNAAGDTVIYEGPNVSGIDPNDPNVEVLHRWTHKGIKVMGRAALNLNHLLPPDRRNPEDLRLFTEVAVLGWEDQPFYYEKRSERMPIMFGVNVPTLKLLDVLSVQGEYYTSPFNNYDKYNSASLPIWDAEFPTVPPPVDAEGRAVPTTDHDDDWKWSIYGRKTLNKLLSVHAQAASDHFRLMRGPRSLKPSYEPLTSTPREWYYLVRLDFALR